MKRSIFFLAALLLGACGAPKDKVAGNDVVAPTAVRALPGGGEVLVLNSAAFGDYSQGSLNLMEVSGEKSLSLKSSVQLPTLGTALAVSADGSLVAVGFVGIDSHVEIFQRRGAGLAKLTRISLPRSNHINGFRFFSFGGKTYLSATLEARTDASRLILWRVEGETASEVLRLPEAFGSAYRLSFASPVFMESQGLLVVFPAHSRFPDGDHTGALAWLKGERARADEDPRPFSAIAIDLERLLGASQAFSASYAAVPLIFDSYGFSGDLSLPSYRPENAGVSYHTRIEDSLQPITAPCAAAYADSLLVADASGVYRLAGWSLLKSDFSAAFGASDLERKVVWGAVKPSLYSSAGASQSLSSFPTRFLAFVETEATAACRPAWMRAEVRSSGQSSARTWLLWNEGISPHAPKNQLFPSRGISDALLLDGKVIGTSFSQSTVDVLNLAP